MGWALPTIAFIWWHRFLNLCSHRRDACATFPIIGRPVGQTCRILGLIPHPEWPNTSMSPSSEIQSKFMEFMLEHNRPRMDGFKSWVFHPGMRFQALEKWWGIRALGPSPMKAWTCIVLRLTAAG